MDALDGVRRGVDDSDGVRRDARRAVPASPWPRAKTGIATAAATTPISAAPPYILRRLRLSSTSRVFSCPKSLGRPVDLELRELLGPVEVLEATLAKIADRNACGQLVLDELSRGPREQHLPSMAGGRNASSLVNAEPDVAILADTGLAGVQAHPHSTSTPSGQG